MLRKILVALGLMPLMVVAQVQLGPCINSGQLPLLTDSVQPVSPFIDTTSAFLSGGYQTGDIVNDFILYDTASVSCQLSQLLDSGKPVFLTSGSYSCPAYRYCMDQVIPDLVAMFGTQVIFVNVYQLEAHPVSPYLSPFSGTVYTTSQNYADNILLPQHRTYGERKNRAMNSMIALGSPSTMLLDGPGNEFWTAFGPSPNNAYLITTDGWVFNKYGWLSQSKTQAIYDINMMLNTTGIQVDGEPDSWIAPMANPGNSLSILTSRSDKPITVLISNAAGQTIFVQSLMPYATFPLGEALPANGQYFVTILAEEHLELFSFLKSD